MRPVYLSAQYRTVKSFCEWMIYFGRFNGIVAIERLDSDRATVIDDCNLAHTFLFID